MTNQADIASFTPDQRELWQRVVDLWALAKGRDQDQIRATLHPDYRGWDMSTPHPHDREAAVLSVAGDSAHVREYELQPHSVQVYDGRVGVVHYDYSAVVMPGAGQPLRVTGKWSEVYLRQGADWLMISVSGRPDAPESSGVVRSK